MARVDVRTVQELGGWRTLSMVQRYAHLSPAHLHAAIEGLVPGPVAATRGRVEVGLELDSGASATSEPPVRVG